MFDPGYMPVTGCDATVSWGGPDFAFRNSTDYPIKITTSYNDETNQLTITLLGTKTDDHYVEMTNQFLSYSERKTVYQESESVAPGTTEVEQYGHNGLRRPDLPQRLRRRRYAPPQHQGGVQRL